MKCIGRGEKFVCESGAEDVWRSGRMVRVHVAERGSGGAMSIVEG